MADESLINLGVAEFENLMETQGLENTVRGVLSIANEELDQEAIGGVPLTFESLKDGSHPILDRLDRYKGLKPEDRNIQTEEILTMFTNVSDFGKYNPEKGNFSGLKAGTYSAARALPETVGGGYGAAKGFATGMYLQSFIPPVGIPGLIGKGIAIAIPTVAGAVAGALGFGKVEDLVLGEAAPVVPSLQSATNLGETGVMAASLVLAPWQQAPKATTGALEFLGNFTNVSSGKFAKIADEAFEVTAKNSGLSEKAFKAANDARLTAQAGPMFGAGAQGVNIGLGRFNPAGYVFNPLKGPVSTRVLGAVEQGVGRSMQVARNNPIPYLAIEGASGAGAAGRAYIAQEVNPYGEGSRFVGELVGSFIVPLPVQAGVSLAPDVFSKVKQWWGKSENTNGLLTNAINRDSVKRIKSAILATGDKSLQAVDSVDGKIMTPDEQFAKFFEELEKLSVDQDGNPVTLTFKDLARDADIAAGTSFSPTINVIQNELEKSSTDLAAATGRGREEMQAGAVNMMRTLAATGDPTALAMSARIQQGLFEQNIIDNIDNSVSNLMEAGIKVIGRDVVDVDGKKIPSNRGKLSESLYEILTKQVDQSKKRERQLWNEVTSYPLTEFYSKNGRQINQPNVLQLLDRSSRTGGLKFSSAGANKELRSVLGGYADDMDEMIEYFQNGVGRNPATAQTFFEMRSGLLNKSATLRKNGDIVNAGRIDKINDALLRDLTGQKNNATEAYNNARAYTFARNNVFRRSFLNDMQVFDKQRGLIMEPQQLLDNMFKGGNLATSRRIKEIRAAGRFLVDEAGFSEEAVHTMETTDIVKAALRDSLSKIMTVKKVPNPANPNEIIERLSVSQARLDTFRAQPGTQELFKFIPELEGELSSVEAAQNAFDNTLGDVSSLINPSKAKQRGFSEDQIQTLYDTKAFQNVLEFEDPSEAVAKALNAEKPTLALNSLFRMVNESNYKGTEYTKDMAMSGLKSALIQHALRQSEKGSSTLLPNGNVLQKQLFGQIEGVPANVKYSLADFMKSKGLVDETVGEDGLTELGRIQKAIKTMRGVEEAFATNNFENILFKKPSLGKLFYTRIFGATAGGAVQNKLKSLLGLPQMGGGLIAEQTGSELVQRFLLSGPESQRIKKMTELFANPNALAALMNEKLTKDAQDNAMTVLEKFISPMVRQIGRRVPYGIIAGEKSISEEYEAPPRPDNNQQGSLVPPPIVPTLGGGNPLSVQQASAAPAGPTIQNSGPVDRERFAAMFPNDSTTQLLKSGIGSLGA